MGMTTYRNSAAPTSLTGCHSVAVSALLNSNRHVLVFRAIQKIGGTGRIESDTRRLTSIRSRKGFLTLSDRTILGANTHLVRGHLDDDTARLLSVNCATRSSALRKSLRFSEREAA